MPAKIHSLATLKPYRQELRKSLTPAEATLWNYLKSSLLKSRKFRRQHSIEGCIADFYCAEEKLIIELDGQGHFTEEGKRQDIERDARLSELGYTVLRFENKQVFTQIETVLENIVAAFGSE